MRVLALTRYAALGASSRLRILQYRTSLACSGIELIEAPFFRDDYIRALYRGEYSLRMSANAYGRRLSTLFSRRDVDAIWIEKEILPWLPWIVERVLLPRSTPLIVDYDDAVFHRYDMHRFSAVRWLLGRKIDAIMARANVVVTGNEYLASRARKAGAKHVEVIPTVVDHRRYCDMSSSAGEKKSVVGWIGSPNTAPYLQLVAPVLHELAAVMPLEIRAIGARENQLPDIRMKAVEWSEDSEVEELGKFAVGIMPLPDRPWEQGKCGYKLIQYMACGLPVIASPVGVNTEIVRHGVTGFLARTDFEWMEAVKTLIGDSGLRAKMGAAGRALVEAEYNLEVQAPRLEMLFRRAVA